MLLQTFGFGHPEGVETLLRILLVERARFPAEVYNGETLPLTEDDEDISELALGLRHAERGPRPRRSGSRGGSRTRLNSKSTCKTGPWRSTRSIPKSFPNGKT